MLWKLLMQPHVKKFYRDLGCFAFMSGGCQVTCPQGKVCVEVPKVITNDVRKSTACLGSAPRFLHWCCGRNIAWPLYRAALNHFFSFATTDLAADRVISRMFCCFERNCFPREIRPPDWESSRTAGSVIPWLCSFISVVFLSVTQSYRSHAPGGPGRYTDWAPCFY